MIIFTVEDDEGLETEYHLPGKMEVCPRCEGHGTHLNPAIGEHAYSIEEFNETFSDPEDREQYFKHGGIYDVRCDVCHGLRVVEVPDEEEIKEDPQVEAQYSLYLEQQQERARWDADDRYTRRMENGGFDG